MRFKSLIPIVLVVCLLVVGVSAAVPGTSPASAQRGQPGAAVTYAIEQGAISGGHYRLTSIARQECNIASGGAYQLLAQAPAAGPVGSGCCCTYLPGIMLRRSR
jgi:hypothetical protein